MENETPQAPETVEEQEEITVETEFSEPEEGEETITVPKSKFTKMQRKAKAFDATRGVPQKPITTTSSDDVWRERMELKVDGYDDEAVTFIMKNGGRKALTNPFVIKAVEAMKEQKQAEAATVDTGPKSEIEKRLNPKDFAKLSSEKQLEALSELN